MESVGSLGFLVESITLITVDGSSITVSGFGASGGCEGDSGGPLLMRGTDGGVEVAGVLSIGSATCREDDTYARLDTIRDWIQTVTGPYVPVDLGCGGVGPEGRCFYGTAVWCSGSAQLSATACSGRRVVRVGSRADGVSLCFFRHRRLRGSRLDRWLRGWRRALVRPGHSRQRAMRVRVMPHRRNYREAVMQWLNRSRPLAR